MTLQDWFYLLAIIALSIWILGQLIEILFAVLALITGE